jgi:hypothetical protein
MGWRWMDNVLWRQNGGDILGRSKGGRRRNGDRDGSLLRDRGREEDEERAGGKQIESPKAGRPSLDGWMLLPPGPPRHYLSTPKTFLGLVY